MFHNKTDAKEKKPEQSVSSYNNSNGHKQIGTNNQEDS